MTIASIEAIPVSDSLSDGRGFGSARGTTSERAVTLVRLETTDGLVGWGDAFAPAQTVATLIETELADDIVGMDPYAAESFVETYYTGSYHFGRDGFYHSALSGIDVACWDLIGKRTGEPIHRLLGGRSRESVTPYASTMYVTDHERDPAAALSEAVDDGFDAVKIKIGRGIADDVARVELARECLGEDATLMVDYNGNYRQKQARKSIRAISEFDITWAEEPLPPEDITGYSELRSAVDVPIAAGEACFSRFDFHRLLSERAVDVVQPDLGRCGGFSEARLIAKNAVAENVAVSPHVWNSAVGVAAALQYVASLPDYPYVTNRAEPLLLECDRSDNRLRTDLLTNPIDLTGGTVSVPQDPGLGIEVDEAAVDRYRID